MTAVSFTVTELTAGFRPLQGPKICCSRRRYCYCWICVRHSSYWDTIRESFREHFCNPLVALDLSVHRRLARKVAWLQMQLICTGGTTLQDGAMLSVYCCSDGCWSPLSFRHSFSVTLKAAPDPGYLFCGEETEFKTILRMSRKLSKIKSLGLIIPFPIIYCFHYFL